MPPVVQLVDAGDLESWAPAAAATGLPRLIHTLLVLTEGVSDVHPPTMDTASGRTVGAATGSQTHPYVPVGRSAWVLASSFEVPADADEAVRLLPSPSGPNPAECLVYVTHRKFPDKAAWSVAARTLSAWNDVRVIDASDLEMWLQTLPFAHLFASELLNRAPIQFATVARWWTRWSRYTAPPTPPKLVLAGRDDLAESLRERVAAGAGLTTILGQSSEEAAAFAAAAALETTGPEDLVLGVVPLDADGLRLSGRMPNGTVIIVLSGPQDVAELLDAGLHVVVPLGAGDPGKARASMVLPPIPRNEAAAALRDAGLPREQAERVASVARRSLLSARRSLALVPDQRPTWSDRPTANLLAPLMLVGSWLDRNAADLLVVKAVTQREWDDVERELIAWLDSEDPPWRVTAGHWYMTDPRDAWELLHSSLITSDLARWEQQALLVLTELDPAQQLPAAERHLAGVKGLTRQFSFELRRGMAEALVLLASGGATPLGTYKAASLARSVVRSVLTSDADQCQLWASLQDVLPLLAEAAPEEFLDALDAGLAGDDPPLMCLFQEPEGPLGLGPSSPHIAVGFAVETLAWSPTHLDRAVTTLARLAELDPGGRSGNRPADSLRRILLPWVPRTSATLRERMDVLGRLDERFPAVAWRLRISLLPSMHDSSHSTHQPRFHVEWIPDHEGVSRAEWSDAVSELVHGGVALAAEEPSRWPDLIPRVQDLMAEERDAVFGALEDLDPDSLTADERLGIWQAVTETAARHSRFQTAQWALPQEAIERMAQLASRFDPIDDRRRFARLFSWRVDVPDVDPYDHEAQEEILRGLRDEAVLEVWRSGGITELSVLARLAELPHLVGWHAAATLGQEGDSALAQMLASPDDNDERLAVGWASSRYNTDGWSWADRIIRTLENAGRYDAAVRLLVAVPASPEVWETAARLGTEWETAYWQSMTPWSGVRDYARSMVPLLIGHHRAWAAVQVLSQLLELGRRDGEQVDSDLAELIVKALVAALEADPAVDHPVGAIDYDVDKLLEGLRSSEAASDEDVAQLEWAFFPLLEFSHDTPSLFRRLAQDPGFFVQLVSLAFRAADEPPKQQDADGGSGPALNAYQVLRQWRTLPGLSDRGIDADALLNWVESARTLLAEARRLDIGEQQIGQMLSGSPPGSDGAWPHEAVRDVLERVEGQHITIGFRIGTFNARGVTTRGLSDGGAQERALAERYRGWASTVRRQWPRTASALDDLALGYERDAEREDEEAAHRADRF